MNELLYFGIGAVSTLIGAVIGIIITNRYLRNF